MSEVERELNDAQHRVEAAKAAYELIVRRMNAELPRFQRERAQVPPPREWPDFKFYCSSLQIQIFACSYQGSRSKFSVRWDSHRDRKGGL